MRTVLQSSNRGIVIRLIGATFVLAITSAIQTLFFEPTVRSYMTPTYTVLEASQKPCSCVETVWLWFGQYLHGMRCFCCVGSSLLHFCHDDRIFCQDGIIPVHLCFKRSNTLAIFEESNLFMIIGVDGKVPDVNQNEWSSVFHSIPRTLANLPMTGISSCG